MGSKERKDREKHEMRELILQTAMKLFLEEGYENVTIRKIADKIEYSPAAIYLYFQDKDDIFFELHNMGFGEFYKKQLSIQSIKDPLERLTAHGMAYVQFAMENPEYYDLMFISSIPAKNIKKFENWECGDRTYDLLKLNIKQCMEAGYFKDSNLEVTAFSLWSYVHGMSALYVRGRLQVIPEEQVKQLISGALGFFKKMI